MLFERQHLLLSLLYALGGEAGNLDFQKWLLLYTRECEATPTYEFVPYKFGGFSFSSYADKRRLIARGLLENDDQKWRLTDSGRTAVRRKGEQRERVDRFCRRYGTMCGTPLIALTYRKFPFFAIRSEILESVLPTVAERDPVNAARPPKRDPGLVTIGYEGKSLEAYLNQLLREGVTVLCDVRRNPLSRKYGFSKGTLGKGCEGVGIRYEHLPELGIASDRRRALNSQADYDALFAEYKRDDLTRQGAALDRIAAWIQKDGERVALTCYELHPQQCHRHCVAAALAPLLPGRADIRHLEEPCPGNAS
ncbi:MAG: DUF488 domain-containing protein [Lentisphaerae bacterium]|nr:DUF488 domain-containing protein [Lentisphaerota bacterium]